MPTDLSKLPPPPKGQTGVTLDALKGLPPPPAGQKGLTPSQIPQAPVSETGSAGQTVLPGSSLGSNLKALPGQAFDVATKIGNLFGGQAIGESLGTAAVNINKLAHGKNPDVPVDIPKTIGGYANAASTIAPVTETAKVLGTAAGTALKAVAGKSSAIAKSIALGKEGLKTLSQIANPLVKEFVPAAQGGAGKTFQTVVDDTHKAVESFVAKSKASLQAVKAAIPNVQVDKAVVGDTIDQAVMKSVMHNAEYHGVQNAHLFNTPEELIHSGLMSSEEVAKTTGIINAVKNWKDYSARGILNLKEQLGAFYKDGLGNSNAVLRNIQSGLKDVVGNVAPSIKPALEKASANIDKADEFTRHLLGSNETTGESKLISLAKNLANPALKGYQHTLIDELKTATGHDVLPKLQAYADYLDLLAKDFPSKTGTIAKTVGKRAAILGGSGLGLGEIKRVLGF